MRRSASRCIAGLLILLLPLLSQNCSSAQDSPPIKRQLYVASPGIRNYLEYGGHGVLVFDIDNGHRSVKRIPTGGLDSDGKPINVKGVCASAATQRLYITTITTLQCLELNTEKLLWERAYEGGCDRMAISPDGSVLYVPSFEKAHWHVVDGQTGDVITLTDETGAAVMSEKMVEIHWQGGKVVRTGDQFGVGRKLQ